MAVCDVQTKRIKLKFLLKGQYIQLLSAEPDLQHLCHQDFLPDNLLYQL